jgi:hypothetical protein
MKKSVFVLVFCLIFPTFVFPAEREFLREYSYTASEFDSKVTARDNAVGQMQAILLREIGEVVIAEQKMESGSKHNQFIYDDYSEKITAITASMVKLEILQENWTGIMYYVRAKMRIDPSDVSKRANEIMLNHNEMKSVQGKNKEILQQIEKLNKEISAMETKMRGNENFLFAQINEYKIRVNNYLQQISQLRKANEELAVQNRLLAQNTSNSTRFQYELTQKDSIINSLNLQITDLRKKQNSSPQVVERVVEREVTAQTRDEITITTIPAGALVYVNEKYIGRTPYSYKNAPHGRIAVRVKASGFDSYTWNINYYGGRLPLNKNFE